MSTSFCHGGYKIEGLLLVFVPLGHFLAVEHTLKSVSPTISDHEAATIFFYHVGWCKSIMKFLTLNMHYKFGYIMDNNFSLHKVDYIYIILHFVNRIHGSNLYNKDSNLDSTRYTLAPNLTPLYWIQIF